MGYKYLHYRKECIDVGLHPLGYARWLARKING